MYITHHQGVSNRRVLDSLWKLHCLSIGDRPLAPGEYLLDRADFDSMMIDDDHRVWVLHDAGRPVACCVVSARGVLSRHLSRRYFQDHHPEQAGRNAVQMVVWLDVHPGIDATLAVKHLVESVTELAEAEAAMLVFDTHEVYDRAGDAVASSPVSMMAASMRSTTDVDVQRFYVVDFAEPATASAGREAGEQQLRQVV